MIAHSQFYFSNRLNFWMLAIQIAKKIAVKHEKTTQEVKLKKKCSGRKRPNKNFHKKDMFTLIASILLEGNFKKSRHARISAKIA